MRLILTKFEKHRSIYPHQLKKGVHEMGVFGDYALKYLEQGYVVFPVVGKGGIGMTPTAWTELTVEKVLEGEFDTGFLRDGEKWVAYENCNIAVLCGEVSGIIGFDIDTDDPQIVSLIDQFIPQSRCVKRGSKGETRFFRYTQDLSSNERKGIYDLLSNRSYSVMPPSIHPNTQMPYVELGESLYHLNPEDLPCIDAKEYEKLKNIIDGMTEYKGKGRDNRLSRTGFAMACRGEPLEVIAEELLQVDLIHHRGDPKGCFFQDTKKAKVRGKTPQQAATSFAKRCLQDATKKGLVRNTNVVEQVFEISSELNDDDIYEPPSFFAGKMPHLHHMISTMGYYLNSSVYQNLETSREILALATFGVIIGNARYLKYEKLISYPNFYITMLQDSTDGKTAITDVVNTMLCTFGLGDRYQNGLKTEAGLLSLFTQQRREIVLNLGEFHTVLEEIEKPGEYTGNLLGFLSEHYTKTGVDYKLPKIKSSEEKTIQTPNISIIASTQPESLNGYIEPLSKQGFFGRFLVSRDNSQTLFNNKLSKKEENDFLVSMQLIVDCLNQTEYHKRFTGVAVGHALDVEEGFYDELSKIYLEYKTRKDGETNQVLKNLYGRANHLLAKLVIVLGVCDLWDGRSIKDKQNPSPFKIATPTGMVPTVATLENLEKGARWIEWYFKYATQFAIPLLPGPMGLILDAIQKKGKDGLNFKELTALAVVRKQSYEATDKQLKKLAELGYIVSVGNKDWKKTHYALKLD